MKKSVFAIALLMTLAMLPFPAFAQQEGTYVFMVGNVRYYGNEGMPGWMGAFAKIDEWARVYAFWAKFQVLPIPGNYTFYEARLASASIIKLNYNGKDFYILGTWDVLKVTLMYHANGTITKIIEVIVADQRGELSVTGSWTLFSIDIVGVPLITGLVTFYWISPGKEIPVGDVKGPLQDVPDGKINIFDLTHVAKGYGSTPGKPEYNFDIDFNFDYKVDIYDLTTIAANLGESYKPPA
jgi:hypothetical protein